MVISGGSRGLGLALVQLMLAKDWTVLDISRRGAALAHAAYQHIALDMAALDANWILLQQQLQTLADMDWKQVVLVNNAGVVGPIAPVAMLDDAQLQANIAVNFGSGLRLMAAFARAFQQHKARKLLISVSSGAALRGYASWAAYCGAKAGLENFVRSLALEQIGQPQPIICVNFGPGVIDTDMQAEIRATDDSLFPDVARFRQLKEDEQLRSPQNVAQALVKLIGGEVENGRRYVVDEFDEV